VNERPLGRKTPTSADVRQQMGGRRREARLGLALNAHDRNTFYTSTLTVTRIIRSTNSGRSRLLQPHAVDELDCEGK
jgi:hypothetical protein